MPQVLAEGYKIATNHGQNIIGLSPTHKAASELKSKGYRQCYTVKGFLFKLYNGKADLARNSLLLVDEAGMVGNSDYLELLKVARSNNCNLILAGDERQLTSVERGGMFAVFASRFGSYELSNIRRQSKVWSREMASCFARSDIACGLQLLEQHNGLKIDHTLEESMVRLINDWSNSKFALNERLIITMRNVEVDSINQGIRELLKAKGLLTGKEYRHYLSSKKHEDYMAGDRILFKTTNKDLQIENGEFATITSVSNDKFVAKIDSGKEIEFNPQDVSFKHGYASTVYKAQGASIK
uniref:ATP-dependent DNA helicase n=1 Tax=Rickettsia tamurae TaxID=334545 RepID=UPI00050A1063